MSLDFDDYPCRYPMTEEIWLGNPVKGQSNQYFWKMFAYIEGKTSSRKLWLFAYAEYRRKWPLLKDEHSRRAVELAERHAEGLVDRDQLRQIAREMQRTDERSRLEAMNICLTCPAESDLYQRTERDVERARAWDEKQAELPKLEVLALLGFCGYEGWVDQQNQWNSLRIAEWVAKLDTSREGYFAKIGLLRHIIGNPFRPVRLSTPCPSFVRELAASLCQGTDCAFALHDALLEAGHTDLAEHFREPVHPRGCWALDLILGKR